MKQLTVKVPGKLMVAGEFAVLEPNYPLLAMAVNRFVYAKIRSTKKNHISLPDIEVSNTGWSFNGLNVRINTKSYRTSYVQTAMSIALRYLQEQKIATTPFSLVVHSELDDKKTGAKFGLGSSAAVTTAVVRAIVQLFLGDKATDELIFKLASIAHVKTQGNGSGADVAASTYGGVILYRSFQAEWLLKEMQAAERLSDLVEKDWTYAAVEQIKFPRDVQLAVGWTGKPASTKSLVKEIKKMNDQQKVVYEKFLQESKTAVEKIVTGMKQADMALFFQGIEENRQALAKIGEAANVPIETEKLRLLSEEAVSFGGVGKLSGAGGGDCGIAFLPASVRRPNLHHAWKKHGIRPLHLKIYERE